MSEPPQAGSDLAASAAKATKTEGGWLLSGTKVWTSGAHLAHQIVVLARTSPVNPRSSSRGLQSVHRAHRVERHHDQPIVIMSGEHHFNEVTFDEVFVSDENLLGEVGAGWHQVTAELSFERSGPERILSTAPLLIALVQLLASQEDLDDHAAAAVGDLLARVISLRQLSVSVARALATGQSPVNEAALVKDLAPASSRSRWNWRPICSPMPQPHRAVTR